MIKIVNYIKNKYSYTKNPKPTTTTCELVSGMVAKGRSED